MQYFLSFVLKYPKSTLLFLTFLSLIALIPLRAIKVGEVREDWLHKNDSTLQNYINFQRSFSTGEEVILAYRLPQGVTPEELGWQQEFCRKLDSVPGVVETKALSKVKPLLHASSVDEIDSLIEAFPEVSRILLSDDKRMTAIVVAMGKKDTYLLPSLDTIELFKKGVISLADQAGQERNQTIYRTGSLFASEKIGESIGYDIMLLFPLTIVFAIIILYSTFRQWVHTIIPIVATAVAILWTMSLKGLFCSPLTPLSSTLFVLISVLGVADSLHLFSHLHQALRRGMNREEALYFSFRRAGKACFYTSLTTTVGFLSLSLSSMPIIRDLGLYAGAGIIFAFVTAMLALPLSVAIVPSIPAQRDLPLGGVTSWITKRVFKNPKLTVFAGLILLLMLLPSVNRSNVDSSIAAYLKKESDVRKHMDTINTSLNGLASTELILSGDSGYFYEKQRLDSLWDLHKRLIEKEEVSSILSFATGFESLSPKSREMLGKKSFRNMYRKRLTQFMTTGFDSTRISLYTNGLSNKEQELFFEAVQKEAQGVFPDLKVVVTGVNKLTQITTEKIVKTQFESLFLAAGIIFVVMLFLFGKRSGFVAVMVNLFPILGIFGMIGYIGFPLNIATATIAAVAIGVVVDDTIHYHFAFKRGLKQGLTPNEAIKQAHHDVGEAMIVSSLIIIVGVLLFLFAQTGLMVQFGILAAVAMVLALVADLYWGPALLLLLYREKK